MREGGERRSEIRLSFKLLNELAKNCPKFPLG